ncbi:MAG: hypothetical protein R6U40_10495 [Desulfobacterales bacterium]
MGKKIPEEINDALNNPEVPNLYSNSFSCALGQGDTVILFKNANKPIATINLSYTTAKTLAIKLQGLISYLEKISGNKIMTTEDITSYIEKGMEKK